ncbi:MAG TPA: penicillin-binding transpeptidase domain-containing protein, partial [Steroidobacteraceae bacterium]
APMQGALVALDPKTGKVLALVEYAKDGNASGLAVRPLYPAASVFKIITGAALLEKGISPTAETCYHGGLRGIVGKLLEDKPRMDRRCMSLSMALAKSANVVFAKMAVKHLDGESLRKEAERFLFNRPIWDVPVEASPANIPDGKLDLAKSAAGFGKVKLSPLHAALIASAVGNGGIAYEPSLIEEVDGEPFRANGTSRLLKQETAAALRDMMKYTVTEGTATSSFRERGRSVLGDIEVAGKTGSMSNHQRPFMDYSWFVGFAPADDPKIAVAAVIVNGLKWRIHAPYVAREAFRAYLVGGALGLPPVARVYRRHRRHR